MSLQAAGADQWLVTYGSCGRCWRWNSDTGGGRSVLVAFESSAASLEEGESESDV